MTSVVVREDESIDDALKRFRNRCRKVGVIREIKKRSFYEKPSEIRKRKAATRKRRTPR